MSPPVITMRLLGRGAHASPRRGCSVLELTSVLCGERWDDRPQTVHPALAEAASAVNDLLSDGQRRLLAPLAPWLAGTSRAGPQAWPAVARACNRAAPLQVSNQRMAARLARRAIRSALPALAAGRTEHDADLALCAALVDCIGACRQLMGAPAVDPRLALMRCPERLDVEPHLIRSPGCDWRDLGFRPARELPPALAPAGRPA